MFKQSYDRRLSMDTDDVLLTAPVSSLLVRTRPRNFFFNVHVFLFGGTDGRIEQSFVDSLLSQQTHWSDVSRQHAAESLGTRLISYLRVESRFSPSSRCLATAKFRIDCLVHGRLISSPRLSSPSRRIRHVSLKNESSSFIVNYARNDIVSTSVSTLVKNSWTFTEQLL